MEGFLLRRVMRLFFIIQRSGLRPAFSLALVLAVLFFTKMRKTTGSKAKNSLKGCKLHLWSWSNRTEAVLEAEIGADAPNLLNVKPIKRNRKAAYYVSYMFHLVFDDLSLNLSINQNNVHQPQAPNGDLMKKMKWEFLKHWKICPNMGFSYLSTCSAFLVGCNPKLRWRPCWDTKIETGLLFLCKPFWRHGSRWKKGDT